MPAEEVGDIGSPPAGQALAPGYGAMQIGRGFPDGVRGDGQRAAEGIQIGIGGLELDACREGRAFCLGRGEDGREVGERCGG